MSFKDKLIKKSKSSTSAPKGKVSEGEERSYYPDTLGIYCEENPNPDKRQYKPKVIAVPPHHKTGTVAFKDNQFKLTPYWMGSLLCEPILINIAYFPPNALYPGTEKKITGGKYDTGIPILESTGIDVPLTYDTLEPVESERVRLKEIISKTKKDDVKSYLGDKLKALEDVSDEEMIRVSHNVKTTTKFYIPVLTSIEEEVENSEGELESAFIPKVVLFEESLGVLKSKAAHANNVISGDYETGELLDYLYSDIDTPDSVGKPIILFRNPLTGGSKNSTPALAVKLVTDKIHSSQQPFYCAEEGEVDADKIKESLERIIVLEMIQLFSKKGDVSSLEGQIKEFYWSEIRNSVERSKE